MLLSPNYGFHFGMSLSEEAYWQRLDTLEVAVQDLRDWRARVERDLSLAEDLTAAPRPSDTENGFGHSVGMPQPLMHISTSPLPPESSELGVRRPVVGRRSLDDVVPVKKPNDKETSDSCSLEPSMWDAALLLGVEGQGSACTAWAVFVYILNIMIQLSLTAIIVVRSMAYAP